MFCQHVYKLSWSVVTLPSFPSLLHLFCDAPHCCLRPQAPLASLLSLSGLHCICNPITSSLSSLKVLSFCPFPLRSTSALSWESVFHLRELKLDAVIDQWTSTSDGYFSVAINAFTQLLSLSPWWQFETLPTQSLMTANTYQELIILEKKC